MAQLLNCKNPSRLSGGANVQCHTFTGGVTQVGNETMGIPKALGIYWDNYLVNNPDVKSMLDTFLAFIVTPSYMQPLTQYGISSAGVFQGSLVVDFNVVVPPNPLDENHIISFLENQINSGSAPQPDGVNYDSLYVIIAPTSVTLEFEGDTSGVGGSSIPSFYVIPRASANVAFLWMSSAYRSMSGRRRASGIFGMRS